MAGRADGRVARDLANISRERIMDSIEQFLKIKILGVDMVGVIGVLFIAAMVYALVGKRGAKSGWRVLAGCVVVAVLGLMMALVQYQRETKAAEVLETWTKTDGVVTRIEEVKSRGRRGRINHTTRATVAFVGPDGKRNEGLLFHEEHVQGSRITIYYDPQKDYSPGASGYKGARELQTPQSTARATGSGLHLVGFISLLVGGGALAFGSYRLFRLVRKGTRAREAVQNSTDFVNV